MFPPLSARIAWRYMRSKKSHSAVGAISVVSICGIAVATAAIICVLSVFNGFKSIIIQRVDTLTPDVIVTPAKGKVIASADSLAAVIGDMKEVEIASPTILENALALYEGRETPVTLKGVDMEKYRKITALNSLITDSLSPDHLPLWSSSVGEEEDDEDNYEEEDPSTRFTTLAVGTASRLNVRPGANILLFAPRREGRVNLANPASSFLRDSVLVTGVYQANQSEYDDNRMVVDINLARDLLQYDFEASAIEIKCAPGTDPEELMSILDSRLNSGKEANYIIKDRLRQQEMNFRMVAIEKWVTFLLLFFILVIASFNIISSLSMLVIEKEKSMSTMRALGMSRKSIASVFRWESVFVMVVGGVTGIIVGLVLCLLQQKFGFIHLQGDPGSLVVRVYPVEVDPMDILITMIPLFVIGLMTAIITGTFAKSRC